MAVITKYGVYAAQLKHTYLVAANCKYRVYTLSIEKKTTEWHQKWNAGFTQPNEEQPLNGSNVEIRFLRNPIEKHPFNDSSSGLQVYMTPLKHAHSIARM